MTDRRPFDEQPHPQYGPCDGFGFGGSCSECRRILYMTADELVATQTKLSAVTKLVREDVANQVCHYGNGLTPDECYTETGRRCLPCKARALLEELNDG